MRPSPNEVYRHFKGNLYKIIGIARHSETEEEMVVYQALYGDFELYVRPLDMFMSPVDKAKYPDVKQEKRFELLGVSAADYEDRKEEAKQVSEPEEPVISYTSEPSGLKPLVEAFLDADTVDERRRILVSLQDIVDQDDITIMATVMDLEIDPELDLAERYRQLMYCLDTKGRFETMRLR